MSLEKKHSKKHSKKQSHRESKPAVDSSPKKISPSCSKEMSHLLCLTQWAYGESCSGSIFLSTLERSLEIRAEDKEPMAKELLRRLSDDRDRVMRSGLLPSWPRIKTKLHSGRDAAVKVRH